MPEIQECDGQGETKADSKSGEEKEEEGEGMTKGEYQRYQRLVLRFFPSYLDYQLYRRPKKRKMLKVIRAYKGWRI